MTCGTTLSACGKEMKWVEVGISSREAGCEAMGLMKHVTSVVAYNAALAACRVQWRLLLLLLPDA